MKPLSRPFYSRPTLEVAPDLVGRTFVHDSDDGLLAGRIVEVEAYCGSEDPGSHAFRGRTPRNEVMFGPAGHLYVYFTYGMHSCCNVVCERDGIPGAVLIRAVEPLQGIELMVKRRGTDTERNLARGPARLCEAFGITRLHNGTDLIEGEIWIEGRQHINGSIRTSLRIGLPPGMTQPWRFFEEGEWTSGPRLGN